MAIYNEDCITGLAGHVPDATIDLTVTSIPLEALYV